MTSLSLEENDRKFTERHDKPALALEHYIVRTVLPQAHPS
jgi:hypothetical protein